MKDSAMRALRHTFSLFLLVIILFLLGYALYRLFAGNSGSLQAEGVILDKGISLELIGTLVGAFVGVIGLMVTSVLNWREDRRREKSFAMTVERQRLEIEKLRLQLDRLRGEPAEFGQSQGAE